MDVSGLIPAESWDSQNDLGLSPINVGDSKIKERLELLARRQMSFYKYCGQVGVKGICGGGSSCARPVVPSCGVAGLKAEPIFSQTEAKHWAKWAGPARAGQFSPCVMKC